MDLRYIFIILNCKIINIFIILNCKILNYKFDKILTNIILNCNNA